MPAEVDQFMNAIAGVESGGAEDPFSVENPSSGAHGKFQIMPDNFGPWAEEAGLGSNAPRTPENQRRVARHKMQQYKRQFGDWDLVATAWFAGPNRAKRLMRGDREVLSYSDGNTTVAEYINRARQNMGRQPNQDTGSPDPTGTPQEQTQGLVDESPGQPTFAQDRERLSSMLASVSDKISSQARTASGVPTLDEGLTAQYGDVNSAMDDNAWDRPSRRDPVDEGTVSRILEDYGYEGFAERVDQPGDTGVPAQGEPAAEQDMPGAPGQELLEIAKQAIGTPYVWGGNDMQRGLDCSGLVQQAAKQMGVSLPRVSRDQARSGTEVSLDDAQPGDLIAFPSRGRQVGHIGILSHQDENGEWNMLHAPRSGRNVTIEPIGSREVATVRRVVDNGAARQQEGDGGGASRAVQTSGARQPANVSGPGSSREPRRAPHPTLPRPQRERRQQNYTGHPTSPGRG